MEPKKKRRKPAWGKLAAITVVLLALAAAWRYTPLNQFASPQRILAFARYLGHIAWAPFVVAAAYTPAAFILFPRPLITLLAIVAFGIWTGLACALAGVLCAALAAYVIGRWLPARIVERVGGSKFESMTPVLREHGVMALFAANLVPTPPFVVQSIAAGAIGINIWHFVLGNLLALVPSLIAVTIFGHQLMTGIEDPSKVSYLALGGALVGLALVGYLAGRWLARQAK